MKKLLVVAILSIGLISCDAAPGNDRQREQIAGTATAVTQTPEGFVSLFNGTNLTGWKSHDGLPGETEPTGKWTVEEGVIVGIQDPPGKGGFLTTTEMFRDFELLLETKIDWPFDTGVFMRVGKNGKSHQVTLDYRDGGQIGAIYCPWTQGSVDRCPDGIKHFKKDQWNQLKITCQGRPARIKVWLNGTLINDFQHTEKTTMGIPEEGTICLQVHPGGEGYSKSKARFRNIFVRRLEPVPARPNILMILVDDLKPAMNIYGDTMAVSPNLDRLASRGIRFDRAYCNQAVCAPSRFNLMTGSHSTASGLYNLGSKLRKVLPNAVTLPQHFSKHGYRTESLGKIYHIGHGNHGDPGSFDVPHFGDKVVEYVLLESNDGGKLTREEGYFSNKGKYDENGKLRPRGAALEAADVSDQAYADGRVAAETIKRLEAAAKRDQPFLIAAGFARPHMPFTVPKKYWDLYDPAKFKLAKINRPPKGAPAYACKPSTGGEISAYKPIPSKGQMPDDIARKLIHGYYASVSYTDAQIGKVLDAVDKLGLANNTIIVLWGDHGFHLGELGMWTKHVNYEKATRIPIVFVAPGVTKPGSVTQAHAETVDIFPTLAELAGLERPAGPQPISGKTLVPVLKDPSKQVRDHAFHCFPRGGMLGRAIRTDRYRLVEWTPHDKKKKAKTKYELYDYTAGDVETVNLADSKPEIVKELAAILARYPEPK